MKTITLSKENIYSHFVRQKGYGRQALYVHIYNVKGCPDQAVYVQDVFPNVEEGLNLHTYEYSSSDDDGNYFDYSGNKIDSDKIFDTIFEGVVAMVSGMEVEVEEYTH